jgi:hypothetical protein
LRADVRLAIEALWVRITLISDSFKRLANLAIIFKLDKTMNIEILIFYRFFLQENVQLNLDE